VHKRLTDVVHLRPTNRADEAWFGDPVPFYWDGTWHLFYVWDQGHLVLPRVCHSWGHFVSKDLVTWDEYPMAVEPEVEASIGTGSIMEHNGLFHMYYLGRYFTTNGVMYETICHATSTDLTTWHKNPKNPISLPDTSRYLVSDWRDGFPIWNEAAGEWWMLTTASVQGGPHNRHGCIGLIASKDLENWEPRDPFWAPSLGWNHECPELFQWNGWWYLLFSGGYGGVAGTFYRRSRSMTGPWEPVKFDTFDGNQFYAAKTAGDENRRIIFGWVPTREGDVDHGKTQWGGHCAMREVWQDAAGYLWAKCPQERLAFGQEQIPVNLTARRGDWTFDGSSAKVAPVNGMAWATMPAPQNSLIRFRFTPHGPTERFGVFVRTQEELRTGYRVAVDQLRDHFSLYSFGNKVHTPPLVRPMLSEPGETVDVTIFVSGTIYEVFINDRHAMVGRYYEHRGDCMGLFVEDGSGEFSNLTVQALPTDTW